jgi:hypothetical protein
VVTDDWISTTYHFGIIEFWNLSHTTATKNEQHRSHPVVTGLPTTIGTVDGTIHDIHYHHHQYHDSTRYDDYNSPPIGRILTPKKKKHKKTQFRHVHTHNNHRSFGTGERKNNEIRKKPTTK